MVFVELQKPAQGLPSEDPTFMIVCMIKGASFDTMLYILYTKYVHGSARPKRYIDSSESSTADQYEADFADRCEPNCTFVSALRHACTY